MTSSKIYTISINRYRMGQGITTRTVEGTLDELYKYFHYTLATGKSYEHERGNRKVNMNPRTGKSLVTALNNATTNAAANGCPSTTFELV